ncbi:hypothetical protein HF086_017016 [Spodoptera exigua]|uniref:Uncharacterized protein n=1 Tax=Spodoptera exigua TaxID=7107 RepID=A0A922SH67_SPOEX|nr:hypothetical protein HF086_017016 [Spodoptera exigua]
MSEEQEQCDSFNSWELNGLNSLDLWDYTVELECLQGTEVLNHSELTQKKGHDFPVDKEQQILKVKIDMPNKTVYRDQHKSYRRLSMEKQIRFDGRSPS